MAADVVWIELHVEAFGEESDDYVSVPRAEWDAMSESERAALIEELYETHMANCVSGGGDVVDAAAVPAAWLSR